MYSIIWNEVSLHVNDFFEFLSWIVFLEKCDNDVESINSYNGDVLFQRGCNYQKNGHYFGVCYAPLFPVFMYSLVVINISWRECIVLCCCHVIKLMIFDCLWRLGRTFYLWSISRIDSCKFSCICAFENVGYWKLRWIYWCQIFDSMLWVQRNWFVKEYES